MEASEIERATFAAVDDAIAQLAVLQEALDAAPAPGLPSEGEAAARHGALKQAALGQRAALASACEVAREGLGETYAEDLAVAVLPILVARQERQRALGGAGDRDQQLDLLAGGLARIAGDARRRLDADLRYLGEKMGRREVLSADLDELRALANAPSPSTSGRLRALLEAATDRDWDGLRMLVSVWYAERSSRAALSGLVEAADGLAEVEELRVEVDAIVLEAHRVAALRVLGALENRGLPSLTATEASLLLIPPAVSAILAPTLASQGLADYTWLVAPLTAAGLLPIGRHIRDQRTERASVRNVVVTTLGPSLLLVAAATQHLEIRAEIRGRGIGLSRRPAQ